MIIGPLVTGSALAKTFPLFCTRGPHLCVILQLAIEELLKVEKFS